MNISQEYREAHGLTRDKIVETMLAFYARIDARCNEILEELHAKGFQLNCKLGCCGCCRDDLTMTRAEAAVIHKLFPNIGQEPAHAPGACAFLDDRGRCRIYKARPYICRTHGLPMRAMISGLEAQNLGMDVDAKGEYEIRDICELNEDCVDIMELDESSCWTQGVAEAQLAVMDACVFGQIMADEDEDRGGSDVSCPEGAIDARGETSPLKKKHPIELARVSMRSFFEN